MKCKLLVLIVSMFLLAACGDDESSNGGEPNQALIDNNFAPFSLLEGSCQLISVDDLGTLIGAGGSLRSAFDWYEYDDYTIAWCETAWSDTTPMGQQTKNAINNYGQALNDEGFYYDMNPDPDIAITLGANVLGHNFAVTSKYEHYDKTDPTKAVQYTYWVSAEIILARMGLYEEDLKYGNY
ncbi:MAG: hypothetical protein LBV04_01025, partial [Deferribacteraceae bacterium]|nr:hypothetical protein [Deferribacteraceae bacterium]